MSCFALVGADYVICGAKRRFFEEMGEVFGGAEGKGYENEIFKGDFTLLLESFDAAKADAGSFGELFLCDVVLDAPLFGSFGDALGDFRWGLKEDVG